MPLENATNIPELVVTNPSSGDGAGSTDNQLRMLKTAVKGSFPGFTGAENVTLSEAEINALPQDIVNAVAAIAGDLVPVGVISLWSGSLATIPTNWALCDGSNGTPDLTDRFVVGAGSTYNVGNTGGANSKTTSSSGAHSHSGKTGATTLTIDQIPSHTHGLDNHEAAGSFLDKVGGGAGSGEGQAYSTDPAGGGQAHDHTISSDGAHTHTVDVRPPYYALAYIQKVA